MKLLTRYTEDKGTEQNYFFIKPGLWTLLICFGSRLILPELFFNVIIFDNHYFQLEDSNLKAVVGESPELKVGSECTE